MGSIIKQMLFIGLFLFFCFYGTMSAQVPQVITYQGYVFENGQPVNASKIITFRLVRDNAGADEELWSSGPVSVVIINGIYSFPLGINNPSVFSTINWNQQIYLKIKIGETTELEKMPFRAVPYALRAQSVEDSIPVGTIIALYPLANPPDNKYWKKCDGTAVPTNSKLYNQLAANGAPDFNVPNLQDKRFLAGVSGPQQNQQGGQATLPEHSHSVQGSTMPGAEHFHMTTLYGLSIDGSGEALIVTEAGGGFPGSTHYFKAIAIEGGEHLHSIMGEADAGKPRANDVSFLPPYQTVVFYIKIN